MRQGSSSERKTTELEASSRFDENEESTCSNESEDESFLSTVNWIASALGAHLQLEERKYGTCQGDLQTRLPCVKMHAGQLLRGRFCHVDVQ